MTLQRKTVTVKPPAPTAQRQAALDDRFGGRGGAPPAVDLLALPVHPRPSGTLPIQRPDDPAEREADRVSAEVSARLGGNGEGPPATATALAGPALQRQAVATEAPAAAFVVDDDADTVGPGQMRKRDLLAALRDASCAAADRALAAAGRDTRGCPYVEKWLSYYAGREARQLERAIRKYAPEARNATSAQEYVAPVAAHIERGAGEWAQTGKLPDLPPELMQAMAGGSMLDLVGGAIGGALSAIGGLFAKGRDGGAVGGVDGGALQRGLSAGRPLEGGTRSRMESAFGYSFAGVRVHTDGRAAALSDQLRARAFTVGDDVAFAGGEYRPGTLVGDALLAHELAHVLQQRPSGAREQPGAAHEADADSDAAEAVAQLHGGRPRRSFRSRLRAAPSLQRCSGPTQVKFPTTSDKPTPGNVDEMIQSDPLIAPRINKKVTVTGHVSVDPSSTYAISDAPAFTTVSDTKGALVPPSGRAIHLHGGPSTSPPIYDKTTLVHESMHFYQSVSFTRISPSEGAEAVAEYFTLHVLKGQETDWGKAAYAMRSAGNPYEADLKAVDSLMKLLGDEGDLADLFFKEGVYEALPTDKRDKVKAWADMMNAGNPAGASKAVEKK